MGNRGGKRLYNQEPSKHATQYPHISHREFPNKKQIRSSRSIIAHIPTNVSRNETQPYLLLSAALSQAVITGTGEKKKKKPLMIKRTEGIMKATTDHQGMENQIEVGDRMCWFLDGWEGRSTLRAEAIAGGYGPW